MVTRRPLRTIALGLEKALETRRAVGNILDNYPSNQEPLPKHLPIIPEQSRTMTTFFINLYEQTFNPTGISHLQLYVGGCVDLAK